MSVIEWLLSNKLGYKLAINKVHEDGVRMMRHCVRLISLFHMDGDFISFSADKMMHKRPSVIWFITWIPNILCG